jgi:hypothetical protein
MCLLFVLAIFGGTTRPCMPSFSLSILEGQLLQASIFGAFEILALIVGFPAFLLASAPSHLTNLQRGWITAGCAVPVILIGIASLLGGSPFFGLTPFMGVGLGYLIRARPRFWPYVLVASFPAALLLGAAIFALLPYGQSNCWV